MIYVVLKILIFVLLAVSGIGFFHYLQKKQLLKNAIHEVLDSLEDVSQEQARELRRTVLYRDETEEKGIKKLLDKPRKRFVYARLERLIPGLKVELWLALKIVIAAILYFAANAISKSFVTGVIVAAAYLFILYVLENILAIANYRRVDDNLVNFIDLLGNYSIVSGDIIGVLHRISGYMPEPLRSVLEECYYDAQTSGDAPTALYSMAEKIEHPKFKELIRNIESCISYTANFQTAVEHSRKIIMEERRAKKERESMLIEAVIGLCFIGLSLIGMFYLVAEMNHISVSDMFMGSVVGRLALAVIVIVLGAIVVEVINLEK